MNTRYYISLRLKMIFGIVVNNMKDVKMNLFLDVDSAMETNDFILDVKETFDTISIEKGLDKIFVDKQTFETREVIFTLSGSSSSLTESLIEYWDSSKNKYCLSIVFSHYVVGEEEKLEKIDGIEKIFKTECGQWILDTGYSKVYVDDFYKSPFAFIRGVEWQ